MTLRLLVSASAALMLAACQTTSPTPSVVTRVACESFAPITYSMTDTPETQDQVREHNAVGVKLCNWSGAK